MDGDGTFISLMAQHFQQAYEYDAFGRMTSATSPLWASPRLLRIYPLWKGGWGDGGADGGLFYGITPYYPCYDANGNVTEYVNGNSGSTASYYRYDAYGNADSLGDLWGDPVLDGTEQNLMGNVFKIYRYPNAKFSAGYFIYRYDGDSPSPSWKLTEQRTGLFTKWHERTQRVPREDEVVTVIGVRCAEKVHIQVGCEGHKKAIIGTVSEKGGRR